MSRFSGAHLARTEPEISETPPLLAVDDAPTKCDVEWHSCGLPAIAGASGCSPHLAGSNPVTPTTVFKDLAMDR